MKASRTPNSMSESALACYHPQDPQGLLEELATHETGVFVVEGGLSFATKTFGPRVTPVLDQYAFSCHLEEEGTVIFRAAVG